MAGIELSRSHNLGKQKARQQADDLAVDLAEKFDVEYAWEEDIMHFQRPGVNGTIEVHAASIRVCVDLSFVLFALKPVIENEIHRHLDEHFTAS